MKKSHLSALPLALMLLFGWSCSHSKTPKQPAEKTAFPIVMLRIVIGLQLMWIHCRTSDVTTLPWPGKNACCRFTPQIMPANRSVNLLSGFSRPKAGSLIWKQPAKWFFGVLKANGIRKQDVFSLFPTVRIWKSGFVILAAPTIFLKRRNRIQNCPTHRKRLCAIKMTLQENRPESDSGRFLICALSIRKGPDVSKTRPFSISGFRRGRPIETPRAAVCLLIGVNYGLFRHCFEIVLITIRDAGRLFLQLILSYPATFL